MEKGICCICRKECYLDSISCATCYSNALIKPSHAEIDLSELKLRIEEIDKKLNEVLKYIQFKKIR